MDVEQILLDIQIDAGAVTEKLKGVKQSLADLKAEQKQLKEFIDAGADATGELTEQYAKNAQQVKLLTATDKALSGQLNTTTYDTKVMGDSFRELDAQCRQLENTYKSLTKEQRESAAGQELKKAIIETKEQLKDFDAELGNHQRNVGNYPQAMGGMINSLNKFANVGTTAKAVVASMQAAATGATAAFKTMGQSIKSATSAALKFLATPIGATLAVVGAVLGVVVAAFRKLSDAFAKNDAAGTSFAKLMASLKPITEAVAKAFNFLANGLAKVMDVMSGWIASNSEAAASAQALVQAQDDLQEAERQYTINSAKRNKEIAELRSKATEAEKYSYAERKQFLQEAIDKERENLEEDKKIKAEQLRILEETAKREQDTSDETMNKIAAARAAMYQAEEQYFTGTRRLQQQMANFDKQEQAEKEKAQAKARQAQKEYEDFRIQVRRETEDALLALEKDDLQRELAQIKLAGEREVETLRTKLKRLRKTDVQAREDLQKLILAKEAETQQKQTDLIIQKTEERAAKTRAILAAREELGVKDAIILGEQRLMRAELEAERLRNLTQEEVGALYKTQEDYDAAVIAADTAVYNERETLEQEYYDRKMQRQQNEFEKRKVAAGENEAERAQIELEQAQIENDQLVNMDEETKARLYSSQEQYEAAMIASNKRLSDAQKNATAIMVKDAAAKANAIAGAIGALSGLLDQFGEENKAAAIASKALALGQIAVQTGIAIAEGITAAQAAGPFPANIVAVATTLTTILTNIATAVSTVKSAKFATGGIVGGDSYTGDRVPIRANSGEMVLTREQQTRLFDAVSGRSDQPLGIDYGMMAQAMASVPAPVMVYTELQEFGDRVATINEIASV